jgi:hypothetical protein
MAVAGFTFMPHTRSFSRAGDGGVAGLEAVILNRASGFGFRASAKPRFSRSPKAEARSPFLIADALYWIQLRQQDWARQLHHTERVSAMTYLDVTFRYGAMPGENELRAIDGMREVYGVRQVWFDEKNRTVRVEFDASRLTQAAVASLLRQAGIDVGEPLALA